MSSNRIRFKLFNADYAISTVESEEYVMNLVDQLETDISKVVTSTPTASLMTASIIASMGYLDEMRKATESLNNMREQIKGYLEDASNAKLATLEAAQEVESLTHEVARLKEAESLRDVREAEALLHAQNEEALRSAQELAARQNVQRVAAIHSMQEANADKGTGEPLEPIHKQKLSAGQCAPLELLEMQDEPDSPDDVRRAGIARKAKEVEVMLTVPASKLEMNKEDEKVGMFDIESVATPFTEIAFDENDDFEAVETSDTKL